MALQNTPESEIRRRIAQQGKITFAEFMRLALYHPSGGYYTSPSAIGAAGDYFTSPTAHPAFGALLAAQLHTMWQALSYPGRFVVVEMGAGGGLLADEIVDCAAALGEDFRGSLRYIALERYAAGGPAPQSKGIQRIIAEGIPLKGIVGCLLSNELVDSFPVHRFAIQGGRVKEIYVTLNEDGKLAETLDEPSTQQIPDRLANLELSLADGFQGEMSLNIRPWLKQVSEALERGFVITIDYGHEASALYAASRAGGTLDTYYRHTKGSSPYQRIGRQDITAQVDFSLVASEGELLGLKAVALLPQAAFLKRLGFDRMVERLRVSGLSQRERNANMMAMRELVKPDGLGGFKVLVQERGTGIQGFDELLPSSEFIDGLETPLLKPHHVPLMEGRYPHLATDFERLWPFDTDSS